MGLTRVNWVSEDVDTRFRSAGVANPSVGGARWIVGQIKKPVPCGRIVGDSVAGRTACDGNTAPATPSVTIDRPPPALPPTRLALVHHL